jgi:hypothetical protein
VKIRSVGGPIFIASGWPGKGHESLLKKTPSERSVVVLAVPAPCVSLRHRQPKTPERIAPRSFLSASEGGAPTELMPFRSSRVPLLAPGLCHVAYRKYATWQMPRGASRSLITA